MSSELATVLVVEDDSIIRMDRWPPVAIIVASGQVVPKASQIPEGGRFFRKPYDRPEIVDAVREMVRL
jgi:hypothetical protein